eukprot:TRINITY_DN7191_c0_g1_i1.p2 TRINITY_DN7191_c0_g1~~TRINITY_DN7191_c0_g1_i1.p2  ORF type:complete len:227 (-),score=37.74 TRINITY_DN7191_c0_g1_i1:17-697(-)
MDSAKNAASIATTLIPINTIATHMLAERLENSKNKGVQFEKMLNELAGLLEIYERFDKDHTKLYQYYIKKDTVVFTVLKDLKLQNKTDSAQDKISNKVMTEENQTDLCKGRSKKQTGKGKDTDVETEKAATAASKVNAVRPKDLGNAADQAKPKAEEKDVPILLNTIHEATIRRQIDKIVVQLKEYWGEKKKRLYEYEARYTYLTEYFDALKDNNNDLRFKECMRK